MVESKNDVVIKKQLLLMDPHYSTSKVTLNDENVFTYLEMQGYDLSLLVKCNDN